MMRALVDQDSGVRHEVACVAGRTPRHRLVIALTPRESLDLELLQGGNHFTAEELDRPHGGLV
jgi:hypothetical protein